AEKAVVTGCVLRLHVSNLRSTRASTTFERQAHAKPDHHRTGHALEALAHACAHAAAAGAADDKSIHAKPRHDQGVIAGDHQNQAAHRVMRLDELGHDGDED